MLLDFLVAFLVVFLVDLVIVRGDFFRWELLDDSIRVVSSTPSVFAIRNLFDIRSGGAFEEEDAVLFRFDSLLNCREDERSVLRFRLLRCSLFLSMFARRANSYSLMPTMLITKKAQ